MVKKTRAEDCLVLVLRSKTILQGYVFSSSAGGEKLLSLQQNYQWAQNELTCYQNLFIKRSSFLEYLPPLII